MRFEAVGPQVSSITYPRVNLCGPTPVKPTSLPDL